jgi:hypothetical protein
MLRKSKRSWHVFFPFLLELLRWCGQRLHRFSSARLNLFEDIPTRPTVMTRDRTAPFQSPRGFPEALR